MTAAKTLALLAILSVLLTACAPGSDSTRGPAPGTSVQPAAPKRITAAIMGDPRTVRNAINAAGGSGSTPGVDALEQLVNVGLASENSESRWVPRVAEQVPTIENGLWKLLPQGGMELTWRIRANARWHDGTPVTAEDFVFTATVGQDSETPVFRDQMYRLIASVEAVDAQTLLIRWNAPFIYAEGMFNGTQTYPLPRHLLEASYSRDKANFTQLPFWNDEFVGTGPYRIKEWVRGSHLVLEANDGYVLGRPKIDLIEVRFIPDPSTLMANLSAGAAELTLGRGLSIEQAAQVRDIWPTGRLEVSPVNWIAMYPQFINPTPAVVGDVTFRRAVYHAVDRGQLAESLQAGLGQVAHSILVPRDSEWADAERALVRYEYDPRRAIQLVEALGYTRGPDGLFRDASGDRLSVELRTVRHDLYEKSLLAVADYLQRVGIGSEANIVPPPRVNDREYRATFPAFEVIENPNRFEGLTRLRLSETPLPENRFTGRNRVRYVDPAFDALLERFFATIPVRERVQVAAQIVRSMTDQLIWMGLFHQVEPIMIANRIAGPAARTQGTTHAWNAHEWDVR